MESLQDPSSWPFPVNWFIGSSLIQDQLRRYDGVDLNTDDPLDYAHLNGCPYVVGVPTLVLIYTLGVLFSSFAPARALFNLVKNILVLVLLSGAYLAASLGAQITFLMLAPLDMMESEETL